MKEVRKKATRPRYVLRHHIIVMVESFINSDFQSLMEGFIESYNGWERQRFGREIERTIDAMRIIAPVEYATSNPYFLNPNLTNFWVNVTKQPTPVTESIRKHAAVHAAGSMPEGFNNIAIYYPGQQTWNLKFSPC